MELLEDPVSKSASQGLPATLLVGLLYRPRYTTRPPCWCSLLCGPPATMAIQRPFRRAHRPQLAPLLTLHRHPLSQTLALRLIRLLALSRPAPPLTADMLQVT